MKKRTIWFCVVMVMATGEQSVLMESTSRIEAEENCDILNSVERNIDVSYQLGKRIEQ